MNKIYKYLLVGLAVLSVWIASFASAETVEDLINYLTTVNITSLSQNSITNVSYFTSSTSKWVYCFEINFSYPSWWSYPGALKVWISDKTYDLPWWWVEVWWAYIPNSLCFYNYTDYVNVQALNKNLTNISLKIYRLDSLLNTTLPVMTSLQCQTNYSLIPISDVTANYCKLNFSLISPTECPESEWTWAVLYTDWYINNVEYPWTRSLKWTIPDEIAYSVTYNTDETLVDVEWYDVDEDYINAIIENEKLTPTNEDFTTLINGLIAFIPYLFIALLFFRFVRIINKIWK